ncbi:MAG: polysaccharide biosynthesis tyrosine autokinase [Anaeromyxobacteraceae bacterium]
MERLSLDVRTAPRTFPLVGGALARRHRGPGLAAPPPGLARFAWGGERLRLDRLTVSADLAGSALRVEVLPGERLSVVAPGGLAAAGRIGETISAARGDSAFALRAVEVVARPGTAFDVTRLKPGEAERELGDRLAVTERARGSGLLAVGVEWDDPARAAEIAGEVAAVYLRGSAARRSAEAARTLALLEERLPLIRAELSADEARLVGYLGQHLAVGLPGGLQAVIRRGTALRRELSEVALLLADARRRFGDEHPAVIALEQRAARIRDGLAGQASSVRAVPEEGAESVRLARDVELNQSLLVLVLARVEELRVVKAGASGNARVVDAPTVPLAPATPQPLPVLACALLVGLAGGRLAASAWSDLDDRDLTPERLEARTGLSFYGRVPRSAGKARTGAPVLALSHPGDPAVDALRAVASGVRFALAEAPARVVLVTGPRPGQGKSFVAANLAALLAAHGQRVLLVDADLRRGVLHRSFRLDRRPGLAEVLAGELALADAARPGGRPGLSLLATGRLPSNPAELLGGERLGAVLDEAAADHDVIVLDAPPALAVTDAALAARRAGVVLLVVHEGRTSIREVDASLRVLARAGVRVNGAVLNGATARAAGRTGG